MPSFGPYLAQLESQGHKVGGESINPGLHPLDYAAATTMGIPVLGDLIGAAADARMYAQEPESRTPLNFGLSALGALPFVPAAAGIMAGKKGLGRLGKNMEPTYHGPEGGPRYEIPDWDIKVNFGKVTPKNRFSGIKTQKLQDLMNHPEFTKAYPDINPDVVGMRFPKSELSKGYYDSEYDHIVLNWTAIEKEAKKAGIPKEDIARETIFHELQHMVQKNEGFPGGGHYTDKDYPRLAGEVEANLVGLRSLEKQTVPPQSQMPLTNQEQIIRYYD